VIVAFVAFVTVTITSSYYKLSSLKKAGIFVIIIFFIVFIMPLLSNYFSVHLLYDETYPLYSRSDTRSESIKRGVFVCDLKMVPSQFNFNDSMSIEIKEAWIEKRWKEGFWFWTTLPGISDYYNVNVLVKEVKGTWFISKANQEYLGYDEPSKELIGTLRGLPSDTLSYYVLKTNGFDFSEPNVLGKLGFILEGNVGTKK
jgi:hypothetical protein